MRDSARLSPSDSHTTVIHGPYSLCASVHTTHLYIHSRCEGPAPPVLPGYTRAQFIDVSDLARLTRLTHSRHPRAKLTMRPRTHDAVIYTLAMKGAAPLVRSEHPPMLHSQPCRPMRGATRTHGVSGLAQLSRSDARTTVVHGTCSVSYTNLTLPTISPV